MVNDFAARAWYTLGYTPFQQITLETHLIPPTMVKGNAELLNTKDIDMKNIMSARHTRTKLCVTFHNKKIKENLQVVRSSIGVLDLL